jgi:hypothetical protein
MRLQVQPKLRRHLEIPPQPQGRVRRDGTLALHDLVDATRWHADVLRQPVLAQAHRLQEILFQNLARRDVSQQFAFHELSIILRTNVTPCVIKGKCRHQVILGQIARASVAGDLGCSPNYAHFG